jgi:hypothetical protein
VQLSLQRVDGALHAPPSGLVPVSLSWSAAQPFTAGRDTITLHCSEQQLGGGAGEFADFLLLQSSSGQLNFTLPHGVGCTFQVRYTQGGAALLGLAAGSAGAAAAAVLASSEPLPLGATTDAVATRLTFGPQAGSMQLTWTSMNDTAPAAVQVGLAPGGPYLWSFAAAFPPTTYKAADMCHSPANETSLVGFLHPGFYHTAALQLNASTRYYAVYGQAGGALAPELTFLTRAAPGPDVPVKFAAFGDSATYFVFPGSITTVDMILALNADAGPLDFVAIM